MKRNLPSLLVFLLLLPAARLDAQTAPGGRTDPVLQARLEELVGEFGGEVGIYVRHLPSGAGAEIRPDEVFPTASLVKVPLLLTLFDQVHRGTLDLRAQLPYPDTLRYQYEESTDVVGYMDPGETLPLSELAFLMLSVSERASETMYRMLTSSYWRDEALSRIPPTVQAASKQGFVSRSRSEVLLVNAPGGDYVLAIITRDQEDTREGPENEGFRLIRAVSRAVYEHFNPADPWRPAR